MRIIKLLILVILFLSSATGQEISIKTGWNLGRSEFESYGGNIVLKSVEAWEYPVYERMDGKPGFIKYLLYSLSRESFFVYYYSMHVGFYIDSAGIEDDKFSNLVDLNLDNFVDSNVAFDSAEANGGYAFRSEPNTIVGITYDLRNYPDDELAPDTVNPYWRVAYFKSDTNFILLDVLYFYFNPSNGRLVKKVEIAPITAKEKFEYIDSLAKSNTSDANLVYVFGIDDTQIDGKCYKWNYGYKTGTGDRFSIWFIYKSAQMDTFFLDMSKMMPLWFNFNKPLQFNNYKDSDFLSAVAEANGGAQFRSECKNVSLSYLYSQSWDTTKIYFHAIYSGIDTATGNEKSLIIFIDPVTGRFVGLFTKAEKDETAGIPTGFALYQNYPNPFNPVTTITYDIPVRTNVKLVIYNVLGQEVATLVQGVQEPGRYNVKFDATGLASGVYFYRLEAGKYIAVKKMMLIK